MNLLTAKDGLQELLHPGSNSPNASDDTQDELVQILERLRFRYPLRKYQDEILDLVNGKVERGERDVHVVAPPGAGKTIIGLQMVCNFGKSALIVCPNTTIQSQWSQKLSLFVPPELAHIETDTLIGTHENKPLKPITVLTYQVLSTPGREQEYLEQMAQSEWVAELKSSRGLSVGESELRILELLQNNPRAHQKEMSRHMSRLRKKLSEVMKLEDVLHKNALELLLWLKRQNIGLVIFDECHHLTDYWAVIMSQMLKLLDDPIVVALTGTPPEGKSTSQSTRYSTLVGTIDYQVPTPALVREGGLAPFQDLVYFTEPTREELAFLESQHEDFHTLVEELVGPNDSPTRYTAKLVEKGDYEVIDKEGNRSDLLTWVLKRALTVADTEGWQQFSVRRPTLSTAICKCLWRYHLPFPRKVEYRGEFAQDLILEDWMCLLEDYASYRLKISPDRSSHDLFEKIRSATRKLGFGLTERGLRRQASPVDRVLAFSRSKARAASEILAVEYRHQQDRLRAIVVTDFERMSATSIKAVKGVLNEDCGGAAGALRTIVSSPVGELVNPCLVTGSLLMVDNRIAEQFEEAAVNFLEREGLNISLEITEFENELYSQVTAQSSSWDSKLYVRLATELFEKGITRCLIGTRGLFGEGWDSQALNTLIDLTTTTAPVSVKQLRGRSIRIQAQDPLGARKVANNWDVVCIAPSLEKGLNDYNRFARKHEGFFGIADDGQIEKGVGHVHPAFSEMTPKQVFESYQRFNEEMIHRALARDEIYDLWKVGTPYKNSTVGCIEVADLKPPELTPPYLRRGVSAKAHAQQLKADKNGVIGDYVGLSALIAPAVGWALSAAHLPLALTALPCAGLIALGIKKYRDVSKKVRDEVLELDDQEGSLSSLATAVMSAMRRQGLLPTHVRKEDIQVRQRADGTYRVFLNNVSFEQSKTFVAAVKELLTPASNQPFVVPRYEFKLDTTDSARRKTKEEKKGKGLSLSLRATKDEESEKTKPDSSQSNQESRSIREEEENKEQERKKDLFVKRYLAGRARPSITGYHPVPSILARSQKGRTAFQDAWNKYVSPGEIIETENSDDNQNEKLSKRFKLGPSLAQRLLWE